MRLFILNFIIITIVVSNTSFAQDVEQSKECPFTAIHRIVIKNDSIVSFYSLDSPVLIEMKEFWYKSTIDSIECILNRSNSRNLNSNLYLSYVFFKKDGQCFYYLSNFPLLNFDTIFTFNNMLHNGKKEDETFSMDFWQENINKEEIKTITPSRPRL